MIYFLQKVFEFEKLIGILSNGKETGHYFAFSSRIINSSKLKY
jgi:hypothetical protein